MTEHGNAKGPRAQHFVGDGVALVAKRYVRIVLDGLRSLVAAVRFLLVLACYALTCHVLTCHDLVAIVSCSKTYCYVV